MDLGSEEQARIAAVRRLGILDTAPERAFDDIVAMAADDAGCPMAMLSFVDERRQWLKAVVGPAPREVPRAESVCANVIAADAPAVLGDLTKDARFRAHPCLRWDPPVRAYVGVPVRSTSGLVLAVLAAMDVRPRRFSKEVATRLERLAGVVAGMLEMRALPRDAAVERDREEMDRMRAHYRALFESAPGCYLVLEPEELRIVAVSDAYLDATFTSREMLAGRKIFEAFPDAPGDTQANGTQNLHLSLDRVRERRETDVMPVQRYPIRLPDGSWEVRWWSPVNAPVLGPDGELAYIIHRVEDVTEYVRLRDSGEHPVPAAGDRVSRQEADLIQRSFELRRLNERLAESERRFADTIHAAPSGFVTFDAEGRFLSVNPAFCQMLGYTETELGELSIADLMFPEEVAEHVERLDRIREGVDERISLEVRVRHREGATVWVRTSVAPVRRGARFQHFIAVTEDVTERRRLVAQAQAASEAAHSLDGALRRTLEHMHDAFFTVDRDWRFVYLNPEAERLLHRARADLVGRYMWDEFPAAVDSVSRREYGRAMATGEVVEFEDGYEPIGRWFAVRAHPSPDGLAVYFRDITETRKVTESLRTSEERFRLLSQATNDAIRDWDLTTDQIWWNAGYATLFGYSVTDRDPTSASWTAFIHPDELESVTKGIRSVIEGRADGDHWSAEYRFRHRDGHYLYVLDRGNVIRDADGRAVRMVGGMTDLTERRAIEQRVERQAALIDQASDAILERDLVHRILTWSRGAEQVYGWTREEAIGRDVRELLYEDPAPFELATAVLFDRGAWAGELQHRTKGGATATMFCRWTLMRDARGEPSSVLAINTDITERRRIEQQFLRAQRIESIGTLAGGIAHDLNNVLAPILLSIEYLLLGERATERIETLRTIEASARRGADMVRQVLTFARGVEGQRIDLRPRQIVEDVAKIAQDTFPKAITIETRFDDDLWPVLGDPTQLHQVLLNLAVNARDAMPNGGVLRFSAENRILDEAAARLDAEASPGPYVILEVQDTGSGISPEVLEKVFDPFFTTKPAGQGTGLGLSTSLAIVRSHGGFLRLYSEPGRGTRARLHLPARPSVTADDLALRASDLPRGRGERILVVDDEPSVRQITKGTLEAFGYRVVEAADGAEAVALFTPLRHEIAAVITDMMMPVMDGAATIKVLRRIDPNVRIIAASGLSADGRVAEVAGAGVRHFLAKPYGAETLLRTLRAVLDEPAS